MRIPVFPLILAILSAPACTSGFKGRKAEPRFKPQDRPPMTNEALQDALDEFGIELPSGVDFPRIDSTLADRGRTTWTPFAGNTEVLLGPSAFTSWALLGSTLAHEVEVHCHQSLLMISFQESLGMDAKGPAERTAYLYEIEQAERFGLSRPEVDRIAETLAALEQVRMTRAE